MASGPGFGNCVASKLLLATPPELPMEERANSVFGKGYQFLSRAIRDLTGEKVEHEHPFPVPATKLSMSMHDHINPPSEA